MALRDYVARLRGARPGTASDATSVGATQSAGATPARGATSDPLAFVTTATSVVLAPHDPTARWTVDPRIAPFVLLTEVEDGAFFVGDLFRRKFSVEAPAIGRHVVAFYRRDPSTFVAAAYTHCWTQGTIGLLGGGCTDGRVLRAMRPDELALVNQAGGLLRQTLGYCFDRFKPGLDAFFGHCGDARAKEVDLAAGFLETEVANLLVRWNRPLPPARQQELLQQAHAIGPF